MTLSDRLYQPVDNAPLIVFRIFFGLLMCAESWGAILTGWVRRTFVDVHFTFNFFGFDWLQILVGPQAYAFYIVMGIFGLMVAFGCYYRMAIIAFTVMWAMTYFAQKTQYNNHYYLVWLVSMLMCFLPAHLDRSWDQKKGRVSRAHHHPVWIHWVFIALVAIVYFYAAIAKLNPDWLDAIPIKYWLSYSKTGLSFLDHWLDQTYVHYLFAWSGIAYDALIIPALIYRPTRKIAFVFSIVFHLLNSIILKIGIFPYFALSFALFFFEPDYVRRLFFKKSLTPDIVVPSFPKTKLLVAGMGVFILVQILLPLRHHVISEEVLWTEAGHRKSWRMMLRARSGRATYTAKNLLTGKTEIVALDQFVKKPQLANVKCYPDFIYQLALKIEDHYRHQWGVDEVGIYVDSYVSINRRNYLPFTDKHFDITSVKWNYWGRQVWILPWPSADPLWQHQQ